MADSRNLDPNKRFVDATLEDLRDLVRAELAAVLEGAAPENDDALLDRTGAAKFLRVSVAQVDKFCREKGMPFHRLGDCKRFTKEELLAWLKAGGK